MNYKPFTKHNFILLVCSNDNEVRKDQNAGGGRALAYSRMPNLNWEILRE